MRHAARPRLLPMAVPLQLLWWAAALGRPVAPAALLVHRLAAPVNHLVSAARRHTLLRWRHEALIQAPPLPSSSMSIPCCHGSQHCTYCTTLAPLYRRGHYTVLPLYFSFLFLHLRPTTITFVCVAPTSVSHTPHTPRTPFTTMCCGCTSHHTYTTYTTQIVVVSFHPRLHVVVPFTPIYSNHPIAVRAHACMHTHSHGTHHGNNDCSRSLRLVMFETHSILVIISRYPCCYAAQCNNLISNTRLSASSLSRILPMAARVCCVCSKPMHVGETSCGGGRCDCST